MLINPKETNTENKTPEQKEKSGVLNQVKYFRDKMSLFMRRDINNEERENEKLKIKSEYRKEDLTNDEKQLVEKSKQEIENLDRQEIDRIQGKITNSENSNDKIQDPNKDEELKIEDEKSSEGRISFFSKAKNFVVDKVIRGAINIVKAPLEIAYDIGASIGSSIKKAVELNKLKDLYSGDGKKIREFLIDKNGLEKVLGIKTDDPMYEEIKIALEDEKGALVMANRIIENMRHLYNKSVDKKSHEATEKIVGKENITDPYSQVTSNQENGKENSTLKRVEKFGVVKILKDPLNQLAELTQLFSGDFILKGMNQADYNEILKSNEMKRALIGNLAEYNQDKENIIKEVEKKGPNTRLTDLASSSLLSMPIRYLKQGGRFLTLGAGILAGPLGTGLMISARGLFEKSFEEAKRKIVQEKGIVGKLNHAFGSGNISAGLINSLKQGPTGVDNFLKSIQSSFTKELIKDNTALEEGLKSLALVIQGGELNIFNENPVEKRNVLYTINETIAKAKILKDSNSEEITQFNFKEIINRNDLVKITGEKENALKRLSNGVFKTFASTADIIRDPKQMKNLFLDVLDKITFNATVGAETAINNVIHNATIDTLSDFSSVTADAYTAALIATEAMHSFTTLPLDIAHAQIAGREQAKESLPPDKDQSGVNFLTGMAKLDELQKFLDEENAKAHEKVKAVNEIRDKVLSFSLKDKLTKENSNNKIQNSNENCEKENADYEIIFDSMTKEQFVTTLKEMWPGKDQKIKAIAQKIYVEKDFSLLPKIEPINFDNPNIEAGFSASRNTIFVSTGVAEISAVYSEIGHYFDSVLNDGNDLRGDEGDIFKARISGREVSKEVLHENDHIYIEGIGEIEMMEKSTFSKLKDEKSAISIKIDKGYEKNPGDNYKLEVRLNDKDRLVDNVYRGIRTALVLENPELIKNKEQLLYMEDYIADKLSGVGDGSKLSQNSYTGKSFEISKALINEASEKAQELDKKGLLNGLDKYVKTIDWTSWEKSTDEIIKELKNEKTKESKDTNTKNQVPKSPTQTNTSPGGSGSSNRSASEARDYQTNTLTNINILEKDEGRRELTLNFNGSSHGNVFIPEGMEIAETNTDGEIKITFQGKEITGRITEKENILYFNDTPFNTGTLKIGGDLYNQLKEVPNTNNQDPNTNNQDPNTKVQDSKEADSTNLITLESKRNNSYELKIAGTDSSHLIDKLLTGVTLGTANDGQLIISYQGKEIARGKVTEADGTLLFETSDGKKTALIGILRNSDKIKELSNGNNADNSNKIEDAFIELDQSSTTWSTIIDPIKSADEKINVLKSVLKDQEKIKINGFEFLRSNDQIYIIDKNKTFKASKENFDVIIKVYNQATNISPQTKTSVDTTSTEGETTATTTNSSIGNNKSETKTYTSDQNKIESPTNPSIENQPAQNTDPATNSNTTGETSEEDLKKSTEVVTDNSQKSDKKPDKIEPSLEEKDTTKAPEQLNNLIFTGENPEISDLTKNYNQIIKENKSKIESVINTQSQILKNKLALGDAIDLDKKSQAIAYLMSGWESANTEEKYKTGETKYKSGLQAIKDFKDDVVKKIEEKTINPGKITAKDFNELIYLPRAQEKLANKIADNSVAPENLMDIMKEVKTESVENILVNKIELTNVNQDNQNNLFNVFNEIDNKDSAGKLIRRIETETPKLITPDFLEGFIVEVVNGKIVYTDKADDNQGSFNTLLYAMPMGKMKELNNEKIDELAEKITDSNVKQNFGLMLKVKLNLKNCLPEDILNNATISSEAFKFIFDKYSLLNNNGVKVEQDRADTVLNIKGEKIHLKGIDQEVKIDITNKTLKIIAKDKDGTTSLLEFDKKTLEKVTQIGVTADDFTSTSEKKIILDKKEITIPINIKSFKLTDPEKLTTELQLKNGLIISGNILPDKSELTIQTSNDAEPKYQNQEVKINDWVETNKNRSFSEGVEVTKDVIESAVNFDKLGENNKDTKANKQTDTNEDNNISNFKSDLLTDLKTVYPNITIDLTQSTDLKTTFVINSKNNGEIPVAIEIGENGTIKSLLIDKQPVEVQGLESAKNSIKQYLTSLNEDQTTKTEKSDQTTDLVNLADDKYLGLTNYLNSINANVETTIGPIIAQMTYLNVNFFIHGDELIIKFKDNPKEILRGKIGVDQNQGKLTLNGKIITNEDMITLFIKEKTNSKVADGMISNDNLAINISEVKLDSSLQDFDIKGNQYSFIYNGKNYNGEIPPNTAKITYLTPQSRQGIYVPMLVFKSANNELITSVNLENKK